MHLKNWVLEYTCLEHLPSAVMESNFALFSYGNQSLKGKTWMIRRHDSTYCALGEATLKVTLLHIVKGLFLIHTMKTSDDGNYKTTN